MIWHDIVHIVDANCKELELGRRRHMEGMAAHIPSGKHTVKLWKIPTFDG